MAEATPEQIAQKVAQDNMRAAGMETPPAQVGTQDEATQPDPTPPIAATPDPDVQVTEPASPPHPETVAWGEYVKMRSEAAKNRKQYQLMKEQQAEAARQAKLADMTESQKLNAQIQHLELENNRLLGNQQRLSKESAIISAATEVGFHNPSDVARIVDLAAIDAFDDGSIDTEQVRAQVQHIAQTRQFMLRAEPKPLGNMGLPTNPPPSTGPVVKHIVTGQGLDMKMAEAQAMMRVGNTRAAARLYNEAWEKSPELRSGYPFKGTNKES